MTSIEMYIEAALQEMLWRSSTRRTRLLWEGMHRAERMLKEQYRWRPFR